MQVNNQIIISPSFLDESWYLPPTCTLISRDRYSCSFSTTIAESGIVFSIPNFWRNKNIILSFDLSSNACIRIQDTDTWGILCDITSVHSPFAMLLPDISEHANLSLAIVAPTDAYTTIDINSFKITTADISRHMYLGNNIVQNLYIGDVEVRKVYLGDVLVYESINPDKSKELLYNIFTSTLYVLKENALSYNEEELELTVNNEIIKVVYDEDNSSLNLGGDK